MSPMLGDETALCQTRSCTLQIQPVMRKIVELCFDSLIQAFLFFIEWLGLVILASSSAVSRGRRRDWFRLVKIRRKDQPIFVSSQRTIQNAEFPLIITMHRSRDRAQLIVEAATRHSANGEIATEEPFS